MSAAPTRSIARGAVAVTAIAASALSVMVFAPNEGRAQEQGVDTVRVDPARPGTVVLDPGETLRVSAVHYATGEEVEIQCNNVIDVYRGDGKLLMSSGIEDVPPGASRSIQFDPKAVAGREPIEVYVVVRHVGGHVVGSTAQIIGPERGAKPAAGATFSPIVLGVSSL